MKVTKARRVGNHLVSENDCLAGDTIDGVHSITVSCRQGLPKVRAMFYCQHLMGMGHLVRSAAIVRALAANFSVTFVTGGPPVAVFDLPLEVNVVRLPAIESDSEYEGLQACDLSMNLEETKVLRKDLLLQAFDSCAPDVLITELYPFGRKQFDFELIPLLERALTRSEKPVIVSSIRDVLVVKKDQAKHERRVCEIINRFYDLVLVHGDERLHRLDETFSRVGDLTCRVDYTGYVVNRADRTAVSDDAADEDPRLPSIVVSVGAGRFPQCHELILATIRAARLLQFRIPHVFHIFAGPLVQPEVYADMESLAMQTQNVRLHRYTPDLAGHMKRSALSISMGGYNTVMDILSSGVPALVSSITSNEDREQSMRATSLERLGVIEVLGPEAQDPETFADAIIQALEMKPTRLNLNLEGAGTTARILTEWMARREEGCMGASSDPCPLNNATGGTL